MIAHFVGLSCVFDSAYHEWILKLTENSLLASFKCFLQWKHEYFNRCKITVMFHEISCFTRFFRDRFANEDILLQVKCSFVPESNLVGLLRKQFGSLNSLLSVLCDLWNFDAGYLFLSTDLANTFHLLFCTFLC